MPPTQLPLLRFDKLLPPVTDAQKRLLDDLSRKPLAVFKESDVREAFLAPLIDLLGYPRGEDYDVQTEHHESARRDDPTNPTGISEEDFGQAFAYAIHTSRRAIFRGFQWLVDKRV
jgi:hypothetical protein